MKQLDILNQYIESSDQLKDVIYSITGNELQALIEGNAIFKLFSNEECNIKLSRSTINKTYMEYPYLDTYLRILHVSVIEFVKNYIKNEEDFYFQLTEYNNRDVIFASILNSFLTELRVNFEIGFKDVEFIENTINELLNEYIDKILIDVKVRKL